MWSKTFLFQLISVFGCCGLLTRTNFHIFRSLALKNDYGSVINRAFPCLGTARASAIKVYRSVFEIFWRLGRFVLIYSSFLKLALIFIEFQALDMPTALVGSGWRISTGTRTPRSSAIPTICQWFPFARICHEDAPSTNFSSEWYNHVGRRRRRHRWMTCNQK
jgi:hypothetical protein